MTARHTAIIETSAFVTIESPLGRIELSSNGRAVTAVTIEGTGDQVFGRLPHGGAIGEPDAVLAQATRELSEYFGGTRRDFSVPVEYAGTEFQRDVWKTIAATPFGETLSYGDIAHRIGRAGAGRAVGGAVGANPIPIIVGCHRILASDRRITGYSGGSGIPTKKQLLSLEGIAYAN